MPSYRFNTCVSQTFRAQLKAHENDGENTTTNHSTPHMLPEDSEIASLLPKNVKVNDL